MGAIWQANSNAEDGVDPEFDDDLWVSKSFAGRWKAGRHQSERFATEDDYGEESFA